MRSDKTDSRDIESNHMMYNIIEYSISIHLFDMLNHNDINDLISSGNTPSYNYSSGYNGE